MIPFNMRLYSSSQMSNGNGTAERRRARTAGQGSREEYPTPANSLTVGVSGKRRRERVQQRPQPALGLENLELNRLGDLVPSFRVRLEVAHRLRKFQRQFGVARLHPGQVGRGIGRKRSYQVVDQLSTVLFHGARGA